MNGQGLEHLALGADTPKELNHAAMVRLLLRAQLQVFEKVAPQLEAGAILGQLQTQLGVLLATWLPRLRNEVEEHRPEELALLALRRLGVVRDASMIQKGDRIEVDVRGCLFLEPALELLPQCNLCVPSLAIESVLTSEDGSLNVGNVVSRTREGCRLLLTRFRDDEVVNHVQLGESPTALAHQPTARSRANSLEVPATEAREQPLELDVLIIEDMPLMVSLIEQLVTYLGCHVVGVARDGVEGLELLRHQSADVVLLDLMMPRMDGLELLGRLDAEKVPLPYVVIVSGIDDPETMAAAKTAGASSFLPKPFTYSQLQQVLRSVPRRSDPATEAR